jgi:hypothetical protein
VEHYHNKSLPLDAVYLDTKMINMKRNFALNAESIDNATALRFVLTEYKTKLIAFIDSAVYAPDEIDPVKSENPTYIEGLGADIFIKSTNFQNTKYNGYLVNLRSLKMCVYIDWFNYDNVQTFWSQQIERYYNVIPFDGLWTFANEAYGLAQGEENLNGESSTARRLQATDGGYDTDWYQTFNESKASTYRLPFTP